MAIIEEVLAEFELSDGTEYRLEYNEGAKIHIHIDSVRIELSPDEFKQVCDVVADGRAELDEMKDA